MESIIKRLMTPDNAVIEKATVELNQALLDNQGLIEICNLIINCQDIEVRQYAAVLLYRRLIKTNVYSTLTIEQSDWIKNNMWKLLLTETNVKVRNHVADVVAATVHQEGLKKGQWVKQVLEHVVIGISAPDLTVSEKNSKIFSLLTEGAAEAFLDYMPQIADLFVAAVQANQTADYRRTTVILHLIEGLAVMVPLTLGKTLAEQAFVRIIPDVLRSMPLFADNVRSVKEFYDTFDFFENLSEYAPKCLTNNVKDVATFCLFVASNDTLHFQKRVKVVSFLGCLAQTKKQALVKAGLVEPMVRTMFALMKSPPQAESEVDDFFDDDSEPTMLSVAGQSLAYMALHLPVEKLFPPLLNLLEPALQSSDIIELRAAFISMAEIAEGCAELISEKYLDTMIALIKNGITHPNMLVRNAAFYCLGQYSEYLQPEISKYAKEILPILFQFLQLICNDPKYKMVQNGGGDIPSNAMKQEERIFYALEVFCENLEAEQLQPHLSVLMESLFATLHPTNVVILRSMSINAISAVINATKVHFMPFFNRLVEMLIPYLAPTEEPDITELREHAIDCLSALALNVGKENFQPIAKSTMDFVLQMLEVSDDPDERRAIYGLLGALAEVFTTDMETIFPKVINTLYDSVLADVEIVKKEDEDKENETEEDANIEIDISDTDGEDSESDEDGFDVEDAFLSEKEEAICTLGSFAKYCGHTFAPYLEMTFHNVYKFIDGPVEIVRDSAVEAIPHIIIAMVRVEQSPQTMSSVSKVVEKLDRVLRNETHMEVALHIVDAYIELLNGLKSLIGDNDKIIKIIVDIAHDIIQRKLKCQFCDLDQEDDNDDEESTIEFSLIENAGDLIPALGGAMRPEKFAAIFEKFCPLLLDTLKKSKKSQDDDNGLIRFFVIGVLADSFKHLGIYTGKYFDILLPHMLRHLKDKSARVRQNTAFGLGELVLHSGETSYAAFPRILTEISEALSSETKPAVLDNLCSTICRLIITNQPGVPLPQVLPALFQYLPLREDFAENKMLVQCWHFLLEKAPDFILSFYGQMVKIGLQVLNLKQYEDDNDTKQSFISLLVDLRNRNVNEFNAIVGQNPAHAEVLNQL